MFVIGDKYKHYDYTEEYIYLGEASTQDVGMFKNGKCTINYQYEYDTMRPCKKTKYPNPPLPHCEERIAFAQGANIEFSITNNGPWCFVADPKWQPHLKYRVKIEKTKDELQIERVEQCIEDHEHFISKYKEELAELKNKIEE